MDKSGSERIVSARSQERASKFREYDIFQNDPERASKIREYDLLRIIRMDQWTRKSPKTRNFIYYE